MPAPNNHDQHRPAESVIQPLTYMVDHQWLEEVGVPVVDQPWLTAANELITIGSANLGNTAGQANREAIVQARSRFFGQLLSWDDRANPVNRPYSNYARLHSELLRPSTAVSVMRLLSEMSYNPSEVLIRTGLPILTNVKRSIVVHNVRFARSVIAPRLDLELDGEGFEEQDY